MRPHSQALLRQSAQGQLPQDAGPLLHCFWSQPHLPHDQPSPLLLAPRSPLCAGPGALASGGDGGSGPRPDAQGCLCSSSPKRQQGKEKRVEHFMAIINQRGKSEQEK